MISTGRLLLLAAAAGLACYSLRRLSVSSSTRIASRPPSPPTPLPLLDRLLDRLFSPSGTAFASSSAAAFARSLSRQLCSSGPNSNSDFNPVCFLHRDAVRDVLTHCAETFARAAVTTYLDNTMHINTFNEIFTGFVSPRHAAEMLELAVAVCNRATETLVRTSHEVIGGSPYPAHERRVVVDAAGKVAYGAVWQFMDLTCGEACTRGLEVVRYCGRRSEVVLTACLCLCLHIYSPPLGA